MSSEKQVALVTGANKGLGLEIARQLGHRGFLVLIGARDASRGKSAASTLQSEGLDAHFLQLDQTDSAQIDEAVNEITARYGRLDVLVNNAGINKEGANFGTSTTRTVTLPDIRETFDANFFGVVELTQKLIPLLLASPAGRIVNHSSILGSLAYHADPESPIYSSKLFAYNASKTALNAFTQHLAYDLKDTPIKVNSAHPGWVKTDLGGDAAPMEVAQGAETAVWLATLPADGPTGGYFHSGKPLPW